MWSETVGLRTRPVSDQKISLGLGLARCGLGFTGLVSSCETGLVTLVVIVILKDTAAFNSSTVYSFSILCLEQHYCGDQQLCLLT